MHGRVLPRLPFACRSSRLVMCTDLAR